METVFDALVIGGGQAGLAAGCHLRRAGLRFAILEAADRPGGSWPGYYASLRPFSPARYAALPGLAFPGDPDRYRARRGGGLPPRLRGALRLARRRRPPRRARRARG